MANDPTFNTPAGQTIARETLIAYLNTGSSSSPTWNAIGTRVENSSAEYDWGEDTTQDVLGNTYSTMKNPVITQSFDGVKLAEGDAAYEAIWTKGIKEQNPQALSNMDVLIVHFYAGTAASPFAERYPQSMVRPTSIGGEGGGNIEMPLEITYGGARQTGTASKGTGGAITFTPAA